MSKHNKDDAQKQGEQDETKELIKKLEKKINRCLKESRIGIEDQLFFGVVISLIVFILELPIDEVTSLIQTAGLTSNTASNIALGVRNIALLFLVAASATRYYGAVSGQRKSMRYRLLSLQCLIMAWNFFILIFAINVSSDTSLNLGPISIPTGIVIMLVASFLMMKLEKKILDFYASRKLIFKKDVTPNISKVFLLFNAGFCFAIAVEFFTIIFLGWNFSSERFLAMWVLLPLLVVLLDLIVERRKKKIKI